MESPFTISQDEDDEDRISALPDHLLLQMLERLDDVREAIRAGALSTRWRHLPHQLSRLHLRVDHFRSATRTTLDQIMEAYTATTWRLLAPPAACECDSCKLSRSAIKTLRLTFFLSAPHLSSIGRAVEDFVSGGDSQSLEFAIVPRNRHPSNAQLAEYGQQLMSYSLACPVTFRWLTRLVLKYLAFGDSDIADLINACDKLESLCLISSRLVEHYSSLKIDAPPCSQLQALEFVAFRCARIELVSVPKLRRVRCDSWPDENPPVRFGDVPELRRVSLASNAMVLQTPFALSECSSRSSRNLSSQHLNFVCQMIWIQPKHPKQLTRIFSNLTSVRLYHNFAECGLNWTLFFLEAAPSLQRFKLNPHSCANKPRVSAENANLVWEPSKDLKHLNLRLLVITGFDEEDKMMNYVRLVMERAVGLKTIQLRDKNNCEACEAAINLESPGRFPVDQASRHRVRKRLTYGLSSPVEITYG